MGAQFQFERLEQTDRAQMKAAFEALQDQDRFENGHSYSGGFGMADGLEFRDDKSFEDRDDAYEWLDENAQKWGAAVAVRHVTAAGDHVGYFIGANCAS